MLHCRVNANRDRYRQGDNQRQKTQFKGNGQSKRQLFSDRCVLPQRVAKVALQNVGDPDEILLVDRFIQTKSGFNHRPVCTGGDIVLCQHEVDDIAGNEANRSEDDHARKQQGWYDREQSSDDKGLHYLSPVRLYMQCANLALPNHEQLPTKLKASFAPYGRIQKSVNWTDCAGTDG